MNPKSVSRLELSQKLYWLKQALKVLQQPDGFEPGPSDSASGCRPIHSAVSATKWLQVPISRIQLHQQNNPSSRAIDQSTSSKAHIMKFTHKEMLILATDVPALGWCRNGFLSRSTLHRTSTGWTHSSSLDRVDGRHAGMVISRGPGFALHKNTKLGRPTRLSVYGVIFVKLSTGTVSD